MNTAIVLTLRAMESNMLVKRKSPLTGEVNVMNLDITDEQIRAFNHGAKIQDAFPHLTADEREFILTGYTKEDWDTLFPLGD